MWDIKFLPWGVYTQDTVKFLWVILEYTHAEGRRHMRVFGTVRIRATSDLREIFRDFEISLSASQISISQLQGSNSERKFKKSCLFKVVRSCRSAEGGSWKVAFRVMFKGRPL